MNRCIIINSSFQNVANLPLTLEVANLGDRFIVLETSQVKSQTELFVKVLKKRHFDNIVRLEISDTPSEIISLLNKTLQRYAPDKAIFIGNGGTKLAFTAICEAIKIYPHEIYYGAQTPNYQVFQGSLFQKQSTRFFSKTNFEIEDIFTLNGCTMEGPGQTGVEIWPNSFATFTDSKYGTDASFTRHCHDLSFIKSEVFKNKKAPGYSEISNVDSDFKPYWERYLSQVLLVIFKRLSDYCEIQTDSLVFDSTFLESMYDNLNKHVFANFAPIDLHVFSSSDTIRDRLEQYSKHVISKLAELLKELRLTAMSYNLLEEQEVIIDELIYSKELKQLVEWNQQYVLRLQEEFSFDNDFHIGPALENAVAQRVLKYLSSNRDIAERVLHSVWYNLKSFRNGTPNAEYDVLLVTKNACLIHLECKSFTATLKDLNARLLEMTTTSTSLSRLYICAPMYTEFHETNWFKRIASFRENVLKTNNLQFCPFTFESQPSAYQSKNSDISISLFESSLEKILLQLFPIKERNG